MKSYLLNQLHDNVSAIDSPLGDRKSILMRYLRSSGLPSDHHDQYSSPNSSRSIVSYNYHNSSSRSSSRSPLSSIENLERSPAVVKVDDDVLVMDDILVGSSAHKGGGKLRLPAIHDSGGSSSASSSASSGGSGHNKRELCLLWEATGACCYGHNCQFAHGQEELRPAQIRAQIKNKLELVMSKPYFSPQSSKHSSSSQLTPETKKSALPAKAAATSKLSKASPIPLTAARHSAPRTTNTDWCPLDDGVAVTLPSETGEPPSREAVQVHIHNVLHGPTRKKRLPVFIDICPE